MSPSILIGSGCPPLASLAPVFRVEHLGASWKHLGGYWVHIGAGLGPVGGGLGVLGVSGVSGLLGVSGVLGVSGECLLDIHCANAV